MVKHELNGRYSITTNATELKLVKDGREQTLKIADDSKDSVLVLEFKGQVYVDEQYEYDMLYHNEYKEFIFYTENELNVSQDVNVVSMPSSGGSGDPDTLPLVSEFAKPHYVGDIPAGQSVQISYTVVNNMGINQIHWLHSGLQSSSSLIGNHTVTVNNGQAYDSPVYVYATHNGNAAFLFTLIKVNSVTNV